MVSFKTLISTFALSFLHQAYAAPVNNRSRDVQLGGSGKMTYYAPGLGACGVVHGDGDMVAAVGTAVFDPHTPAGNPNHNTLCGQSVNISRNGKTVTVQIWDRCEGCAPGDIDVSPAAFAQLADMAEGRIGVSWTQ